MATKFKKGDLIVATDYIIGRHNNCPQWYPACGTTGTILNADDENNICVQWQKGSTSTDDIWYATKYDLRKITKRDQRLFVHYYEKYMNTNTTSVKQYYKNPSKVKIKIEEQSLEEMKHQKGYGYKVLGGNSQYFIAAFIVEKILHVHTVHSLVRIDLDYARELYQKRKARMEELQILVNDAMMDIINGDD